MASQIPDDLSLVPPDASAAEGAIKSARVPRGTGRRFHGAIVNKLGTAILSGEFAPGDKLSGEVEFSEALDVSRAAFRESIQVLAAKGLVESRPKAGTRVLPRSRWNLLDPDVLAWRPSGATRTICGG
jgi:DNA-binding FadR family transcriptional regulator